jgi:glycine cleavage system H protein
LRFLCAFAPLRELSRQTIGEVKVKPEDLKYAKTHEWVAVEGDVATVGISAFAVEALTDLVFIELPKVGMKVAAEQPFCEVESVKAVSDVYAPVAGEVIEVNKSLPDRLEILSSNPYDEGWIAKIRISDDSNLGKLMDYKAYQKQCAEEGH